uniref:Uncharacterized protein n=1 Tax=Onchocerca volvulus TaxID=6282 RepID=A0A8R1TU16_ONCVO
MAARSVSFRNHSIESILALQSRTLGPRTLLRDIENGQYSPQIFLLLFFSDQQHELEIRSTYIKPAS